MQINNMSSAENDEITNFRAIFEAMPGNFIVVQPNEPHFTILAVSNQLLQSGAAAREHIVGKSIFTATPNPIQATAATELANLKALLADALRYKKPQQAPLIGHDIENEPGTQPNGYRQASCTPVLNQNGAVSYIIIALEAIAGTVVSEKKPPNISEIEKVKDLFMQAPIAICMVKGPNYIVELANEDMLQFLGRTSAMINNPLIESLPEAGLQGLIAILDNVRATGEPYYVSSFPAIILINGVREQRYFNLIFKPYYENPSATEVTHIFCVANNVTNEVLARQKAEQATAALHFRNALFEAQNEATPDGVLIVDANGNMLLQNKRFEELWNIPQEIINNKDDDASLQHATTMVADPQGFLSRVQHLYAHNKETSREEILFKDGRVIERSGNPIVAENGVYYGWAWYFRDVTERIKQEQKLIESESLFRNMVEQAPVAITLTRGEDMIIESINPPMLKIMDNRRKEEVIGRKLIEVLPEITNDPVLRIVKKVLHTGEPFKGDEVLVNLLIDGKLQEHYFNLSYTPVLEEGKITSVLQVAIDVTERVLVRKSLEESEKNLRNIILKAPVAMGLVRGPEHIVEIANDRQFEIWGRKEEEILNKPIFKALPEIKNQGFEAILNKVYTTGESFSAFGLPITLLRNGVEETIYVNVAFEAFRGGDGKIAGIMSATIEVTELVMTIKKLETAEARARLAVESADQGTYEINLLTNEVFASPRMAAIFGVEPDAGRDQYVNALFPEDQKIRKDAYNKAYQTGRLTYEGRVVYKDKSVHWIRVNGKIFFDEQNKPTTVLGVVQDITIEKEIARQKDDFISIVSHELKTPITSLKGYAQILTRKYSLLKDEESTGMLHKMNNQVNRLNYIVQDLLDVSRIEGNRILFRTAAFNFQDLVAQTVEEVQRTTETHQIIIETNKSVVVQADRERTGQVLINLLTNAIAYSPNGSNVIVATYCNDTEVVCAVKDVGSGIEKEKQTRIFERFYRATDVNRYNGGLGLGLYISAEIIKRQKGRIWVESEPGKGSTFYFTVLLK